MNEILENDSNARIAVGLFYFAAQALNNTIPTKIGQTDGSIVYSGVTRNKGETDIDIMVSKIPIEKTNKFNGCNALALIDQYSKILNFPDDSVELAKKRIEDFNNNKSVILPFDLRQTMVRLFVERSTDIRLKVNGYINGIKYAVDRDTLMFDYILKIVCPSEEFKRIEVSITKVNEDVYISNYETSKQIAINDENIIKFNRFGCVQPIELQHKDGSAYILDNICVMYKDTNNKIKIIGKLEPNGFKKEVGIDDKYLQDRGIIELINHKMYLSFYQRYMLPYGTYDSNKILL